MPWRPKTRGSLPNRVPTYTQGWLHSIRYKGGVRDAHGRVVRGKPMHSRPYLYYATLRNAVI